jgi:hypothetical protein
MHLIVTQHTCDQTVARHLETVHGFTRPPVTFTNGDMQKLAGRAAQLDRRFDVASAH